MSRVRYARGESEGSPVVFGRYAASSYRSLDHRRALLRRDDSTGCHDGSGARPEEQGLLSADLHSGPISELIIGPPTEATAVEAHVRESRNVHVDYTSKLKKEMIVNKTNKNVRKKKNIAILRCTYLQRCIFFFPSHHHRHPCFLFRWNSYTNYLSLDSVILHLKHAQNPAGFTGRISRGRKERERWSSPRCVAFKPISGPWLWKIFPRRRFNWEF